MTASSSRPSPLQWRRGPRSSFSLGTEPGVYALFLRSGSTLPGVRPGQEGLLYIGLAANRDGLRGRCHFNARTRNHSPRKSLAALLVEELSLTPVLVPKPGSPDTWGLDAESDARLSAWMHENLDLAVEICSDPDALETELVRQLSPPLNLAKCVQTPEHQRISRAREAMMTRAKRALILGTAGTPNPTSIARGTASNLRWHDGDGDRANVAPASPAAATMDTAEAIAVRYDLDPKSYREKLRERISWYRKPQDWTFASGSREWQDMIAIAEEMTKRRR